MQDVLVEGSAESLKEIAGAYQIVYLGARPESARAITEEWLRIHGFPDGVLYLGETHADRWALLPELNRGRLFVAGIGDRWDGNELHHELECPSLILKEYEGNWEWVREHLLLGQLKVQDALVEQVLTQYGQFEMDLHSEANFPRAAFGRFQEAVMRYLDTLGSAPLVHRKVAGVVCGLRELLQLEAFQTPGQILQQTDTLEHRLLHGYDPYAPDPELDD